MRIMRNSGPPPSDTAPEVERVLLERWRAMTTAEKAALVERLTRASEALALAGIRDRHPHADEEELRLRLGGLRIGRRLMVEVYGWDPGEGPG